MRKNKKITRRVSTSAVKTQEVKDQKQIDYEREFKTFHAVIDFFKQDKMPFWAKDEIEEFLNDKEKVKEFFAYERKGVISNNEYLISLQNFNETIEEMENQVPKITDKIKTNLNFDKEDKDGKLIEIHLRDQFALMHVVFSFYKEIKKYLSLKNSAKFINNLIDKKKGLKNIKSFNSSEILKFLQKEVNLSEEQIVKIADRSKTFLIDGRVKDARGSKALLKILVNKIYSMVNPERVPFSNLKNCQQFEIIENFEEYFKNVVIEKSSSLKSENMMKFNVDFLCGKKIIEATEHLRTENKNNTQANQEFDFLAHKYADLKIDISAEQLLDFAKSPSYLLCSPTQMLKGLNFLENAMGAYFKKSSKEFNVLSGDNIIDIMNLQRIIPKDINNVLCQDNKTIREKIRNSKSDYDLIKNMELIECFMPNRDLFIKFVKENPVSIIKRTEVLRSKIQELLNNSQLGKEKLENEIATLLKKNEDFEKVLEKINKEADEDFVLNARSFKSKDVSIEINSIKLKELGFDVENLKAVLKKEKSTPSIKRKNADRKKNIVKGSSEKQNKIDPLQDGEVDIAEIIKKENEGDSKPELKISENNLFSAIKRMTNEEKEAFYKFDYIKTYLETCENARFANTDIVIKDGMIGINYDYLENEIFMEFDCLIKENAKVVKAAEELNSKELVKYCRRAKSNLKLEKIKVENALKDLYQNLIKERNDIKKIHDTYRAVREQNKYDVSYISHSKFKNDENQEFENQKDLINSIIKDLEKYLVKKGLLKRTARK